MWWYRVCGSSFDYLPLYVVVTVLRSPQHLAVFTKVTATQPKSFKVQMVWILAVLVLRPR